MSSSHFNLHSSFSFPPAFSPSISLPESSRLLFPLPRLLSQHRHGRVGDSPRVVRPLWRHRGRGCWWYYTAGTSTHRKCLFSEPANSRMEILSGFCFRLISRSWLALAKRGNYFLGSQWNGYLRHLLIYLLADTKVRAWRLLDLFPQARQTRI